MFLIDPFDSNHWLYGTGETIYGGHDLLKWDTVHNVSLDSLANGVEEDAVQSIISPTAGAHLLSAVGDNGGKYLQYHSEFCWYLWANVSNTAKVMYTMTWPNHRRQPSALFGTQMSTLILPETIHWPWSESEIAMGMIPDFFTDSRINVSQRNCTLYWWRRNLARESQ